MAKMLVIQHEDNATLGRFEPLWRDAGIDVDIVEAWHHPLPDTLDGYAGLCVLGGSMDCTDDANHGWLPQVRTLIREAVETDVPFLGICLGLQLATVALGGTVERKGALSLGLFEHTLNAEADGDLLFSALPTSSYAVHYNQDHITTLGRGARVLAYASDGHIQSARLGRRAWGVQFHPEVTTAIFCDWTTDKPGDKAPTPPQGPLVDVVDEVVRAEPQLDAQWSPFAARFADIVRGAPC